MGLFRDSTRRVDLLAIDRTGSLVVIELKRTDDGGHMELQALRYAAMVSTMTTEQLYSAYAHYIKVDENVAQKAILEWVEDVEQVERLADQVRIILVSADFSTEITSTVLWLNQNYGLDIRCHRITSYRSVARWSSISSRSCRFRRLPIFRFSNVKRAPSVPSRSQAKDVTTRSTTCTSATTYGLR